MKYTPEIEFYKKRPFGDKLNATIVFVRENALPLLKVHLLIAGPILLLMTILVNQYSFDFLGLLNQEEFNGSQVMSLFKVYGVLMISGVVTGAVMPAVTFSYMRSYQEIEPRMIKTSDITYGLSGRIFNLVAFNILYFLILIFVGGVIGLLAGISANASVFFTVIFILILLVVLVYFAVTMSLGSAAIVFEGNNPIDAIGRCFRLIAGKWWSTFGILFVMGILAAIINQFFSLPRAIFFVVKGAIGMSDSGDLSTLMEMSTTDQLLNIVFSALETFGSIVTGSLLFIAIAFQYFNLVERKDSKGLLSQIESMDAQSVDDDDEVY